MHAHFLQHVPFEGLGSIQAWLDQHGCHVTSTALYRAAALPEPDSFDWLIVMGGPMGVDDTDDYPWLSDELQFIRRSIEAGRIVLGICLGAQLIAKALGGTVSRNPDKEIGWFPVYKDPSLEPHPLSRLFPDQITTFHWHGDTFSLPGNALRLAGSDACRNQGFVYQQRVLALQFHPEMTMTSIQALVRNCADELVEGPTIQSARDMLANVQYIDSNLKVMGQLLAYLYGQHKP